MTNRRKAKARRNRARKVLATWRTLIDNIQTMTEEQLEEAIRLEGAKSVDTRRMDIIKRMHSRYSRLRKERELQELSV